MREKLASRIGFILLSAGCAIGLGNIWRFPYVAGRDGGAWFVLFYLAALVLIGVPILMMEFATGRAAQRSIARLHETLTPTKRAWRLHGFAGFIGMIILMMFYTTVTGWMLIYFVKTALTLIPAPPEQAFATMLASPVRQIVAMLVVSVSAVVICAIGLEKGVERVAKWLMGGLFLLLIVLAVNSLFLKNAEQGLFFYLVPKLDSLRQVGFCRVLVDAMNQAFFTLSLGIGSMSVFGSYLGEERSLLGEALHVSALDTLVALIAGLVILPACFSFGIEPGQGPGLVFVTLPQVFSCMPFGKFWGSLFFLFMSAAAFTTVLAVFEALRACISDWTHLSRAKSALLLALAVPVLSLPCILGFNRCAAFHPLGGNSTILDLEDFLVSNFLLPLGGLAFVYYCTSRAGWGWRNFLAEANAGEGLKIPSSIRFARYCTFVLPLLVIAIFILGLWEKFKS